MNKIKVPHREHKNNEGYKRAAIIIIVGLFFVAGMILISSKIKELLVYPQIKNLDFIEINKIIEGLSEFYEDCGTFPTEIKGLVEQDGVNTLDGSSMAKCWNGPYIKYYKLVSGSSTELQGFWGTRMSLMISSNNGDLNNNGSRNDYAIKVTRVPELAAKLVERDVDNDNPNNISASTTGKWVYKCKKEVCTCMFVFREFY